MTRRCAGRGRLAGLLSALLAVLLTSSCSRNGASPASGSEKPNKWTISRMPDGQPDIQGMWMNYDTTPFEAPEKGPAFVPSLQANLGPGAAPDLGGTPIFGKGENKPRIPRRRSMVVDPPSGRVPVLPSALEKLAYNKAHLNDSWEYLTSWERCITRGPGSRFPTVADSAYQIVQVPGYVVFIQEVLNEPRIIPIDGRPHLPPNIRLWNGDPRGRWEGDTLVVETTNFHDRGNIATNQAAQRLRGLPHSEQLRLVERFRRISDDTMEYEITIEDPKIFSAPWKVAGPMTRDDSYRMYESACHEGNAHFIEATLRAGQKK